MSGDPNRLAVAGIGSMVVDRIHRVARILGPDEKGMLRSFDDGRPQHSYVGGVVLNHLGWAAALGLRTGIFGKQADDSGGRYLRAAMDRLGIEHQIILNGSSSSEAKIFVDQEGGRSIYMAPGATAETTAEHVRDHHTGFIHRAARLTTEVSQLPLLAVLEALRIAKEAGIPTVVDLDVPPSDALPGLGDDQTLREVLEIADLIKPSTSAAQELVPDAKGDALALARGIRERFGSTAVVVTDGEAGCAIAAEGFEDRVPGFRAEVVDTTGAGDAFLGGLLVALDQGFEWPDAARLANACGAACVEKLGAFPEDPVGARQRVLDLYDGALDLEAPRVASQPTTEETREVLETFEVALEELADLRDRIDAASYEAAVSLIREAQEKGGRVHVTGVGKPEHVAHYAAALLSSTGTPATFLHGTEAIHGSAGQVVRGDVVIAVSNSGETPEMRSAVETVRGLGAKVIGISGRLRSWLGRNSDAVLDAGVRREGGGLGLAPRASVAAEILVVSALAAALERARDFTHADYVARHPAGALGKRVRDLSD